jgi:hypothetical protein
VRRDVAGRSGVGVFPPHPADVAGLFQHRHVGETVSGQLVGGAETAESSSDDDDARAAMGGSHTQNATATGVVAGRALRTANP